MNSKGVWLGIDMGATHTRLCILDDHKTIVELTKIKTQTLIADGLCSGLKTFIDKALNAHHLFLHRGVIGLPATISRDRKQVLSTPNLQVSAADFLTAVEQLQQVYGCPFELERDVNLQLAYDIYHLKVHDKAVLGFYLGSGFGFSVWLNGDTYVGSHGVAGELGHIPYGDQQVACGCGNQGCLESRVSGVRLKAFYDAQQADYPIEDFFYQDCNAQFIEVFIDDTAKAIATAINLFDPDIALLGGGVMDMRNFPVSELKKRAGLYIRKPLPHDEMTFLKATSSAFNGATGAALQARGRTS